MSEHVERPDRPLIPVAMYALAAVVVSERAILRDGRPWVESVPFRVTVLLVMLIVVCALVGRMFGMPAPGWLAIVGVGLACSIVLASLSLDRGEQLSASLASRSISTCRFELLSDPHGSATGYRARARVTCEDGTSGDVWLVTSQSIDRGCIVSGIGRYSPNREDEWGISSRMQGVWGSVRLLRVTSCEQPGGVMGLLGDVRSTVLRGLDATGSETRALLAGCICGYRDGLESFGLDELFSRCGVAHLVAVSGGHLTLVMGVVVALLRVVRLRPALRSVVVALACGMFVVFCGAPVSAVRAWLMLASAMLGRVLGRRPHSLSGVSAIGLAMALQDPCVAGQLGFLLSVTTVCGLGLFSSYAEYVLAVIFHGVRPPRFMPRFLWRRMNKFVRASRSCLAATLVAQLVTLPLVADSFGGVSVVGPLANMLVSVPFSAFVSVGLVAALASGLPVVGGALLWVTDLVGEIIIGALSIIGRLPMGYVTLEIAIPVLWAIVLLGMSALLIFWPRVLRAPVAAAGAILVAVGVACALRWRCLAPPRVCVLDVGQGDAILIQDGSHAMLVDAGPDDAVVRALQRNHVLHLDAVLITHLHDDHYAGVERLAGFVTCDEVIVGKGASASLPQELATSVRDLTGKGVEEVAYGDVIVVGEYRLRVISPTESRSGNENPDSVELALTYERDGKSMSGLLTGDAEREETGAAIGREDIGDVDFLKVGHHGSAESIGREQVVTLDPEVAIASAGEGNRYGHPTKACVDTIEGAGCRFYCTKDVGDVELRPGDEGVTIATQRVA